LKNDRDGDEAERPPRKRIKTQTDKPEFTPEGSSEGTRPAGGFRGPRREPGFGAGKESRGSRPDFKKEGFRDARSGSGDRERRERPSGGFRPEGNRPFKPGFSGGNRDSDRRPRFDREGGKPEFRPDRKPDSGYPVRSDRRPSGGFEQDGDRGRTDRRPKENSRLGKQAPSQFRQFRRGDSGFEPGKAPDYDLKKTGRPARKIKESEENEIRLNRFIAQSGLCSRREADVLISSGQITVNGKVVDQMGYKVKKDDVVKYGKRILNREKLVYVLLNKPKDFLTTTDDPEERKTVMQLVDKACEERIYPVGRLDRNTTGLLLLTNDGELSEKLMHPSHNVKKIYQVDLDKAISQADEAKIREGVTLEDGFAPVDELEVLSADRHILGISIHLGRNRIVRRIFEHLGYKVEKLDRVMYAGLTKKDLPRGNWRYLSEKEVINLKYFS
jgi:23S rRNA pseudouridine2605 synthase